MNECPQIGNHIFDFIIMFPSWFIWLIIATLVNGDHPVKYQNSLSIHTFNLRPHAIVFFYLKTNFNEFERSFFIFEEFATFPFSLKKLLQNSQQIQIANQPVILVEFGNLVAPRIPKLWKSMNEYHQRFTLIARFNVMQTNSLQKQIQ